jgi:IS30 family transposase
VATTSSIHNRRDTVAKASSSALGSSITIQFDQKFHKVDVTSLVERIKRFAVFLRDNERQSRSISDCQIRALQSQPLAPATTFNRSTVFAEWSHLRGTHRNAEMFLRSAVFLRKTP